MCRMDIITSESELKSFDNSWNKCSIHTTLSRQWMCVKIQKKKNTVNCANFLFQNVISIDFVYDWQLSNDGDLSWLQILDIGWNSAPEIDSLDCAMFTHYPTSVCTFREEKKKRFFFFLFILTLKRYAHIEYSA